jgi:hypothetical protein
MIGRPPTFTANARWSIPPSGEPMGRAQAFCVASTPRHIYTLTAGRRFLQKGPWGMSIIISILITVLVIALVLYLVQKLPIDSTMKQMAQIVVVVVGIVSLLSSLDVF